MKKLALNLSRTLLASGLLLLAGCSTPETPKPKTARPASLIELQALDLNVVNEYVSPERPPAIDYLYQPSLADRIAKFSSARIKTVGPSGHVHVLIKDASVTLQKFTPPEQEEGISNMLTRQQSMKMIANADVVVTGEVPEWHYNGYAEGKASQSITLPENPTAKERQQAYDQLVVKLLDELNENIEISVRQHLRQMVVR